MTRAGPRDGVIADNVRPLWDALARALDDHGPAPCARQPEAWWPTDVRDELAGEIAAQVCWQCPLRDPCGRYAEAAGEREGIWAGTDRRRLRRPGPRS